MERVQDAIEFLLTQRDHIRPSHLAKQMGISIQAASKWLQKLERLGDLVRDPDARYGRFKVASSNDTGGAGHPGEFWHALTKSCSSFAYVEVASLGTRRPRRVSQARLLLSDYDMRRLVVVDFAGIDWMSEAFAEQLMIRGSKFRQPIHTTPEVAEIIARVRKLSVALPEKKPVPPWITPVQPRPSAAPFFWRADDFVI